MIPPWQSWIEQATGIAPITQQRVWSSLLLVAVMWLAYRLALLFLTRGVSDVQVRYRWRKTAGYATTLLGLLLVGRVWFESYRSLATYLGLVSAGVAIALQSLLLNLAGWLFIVTRRPFQVGDRIEIDGTAGDVIDVRPFQFSLLEVGNWVGADQSSGRIIHVPNGVVFTKPVANYTAEFAFIWIEIPVLVTLESDWENAKRLLEEIGEHHSHDAAREAAAQISKSQRFLIRYAKLTPTVYTAVRDSGVELTLRTLVEVRKRRGHEQAIWEDVLRGVAQHPDIDLAYPTYRVYNEAVEGAAASRRRNARPDEERS